MTLSWERMRWRWKPQNIGWCWKKNEITVPSNFFGCNTQNLSFFSTIFWVCVLIANDLEFFSRARAQCVAKTCLELPGWWEKRSEKNQKRVHSQFYCYLRRVKSFWSDNSLMSWRFDYLDVWDFRRALINSVRVKQSGHWKQCKEREWKSTRDRE